MPPKDLKNKPLVEAILEVRWLLGSPGTEPPADPNYTVLVGRYFDRVLAEYPEYEQLPTATVPDEMVPYLAQHRFRVAPGGWPLTQLGPGVLTLNVTDSYTWTDFRERSNKALAALLDAYPSPGRLKMSSVSLRYIDAVEFDYRNQSVLQFMSDKMGVNLNLPSSLFDQSVADPRPSTLNWQCAFPCSDPPGTVALRFLTGHKAGRPALIWETVVGSADATAPNEPGEFGDWLDKAHRVSEDWFFKLIEGELERSFSGD